MSRLAFVSSVTCLVAGAVIGASIAYANQPHMVSALELLQSARGELTRATANKGGHRERALNAVDNAIRETREGIRFAGG
jgi:ribose/xylose/arabinose/galactoside ABC-type transport system permease subunit